MKTPKKSGKLDSCDKLTTCSMNKQQHSSFFRAKTHHRAHRTTWHTSHTGRNHTDHNEKRHLPPHCHTCHSELVANGQTFWTSCFPPALAAPGSSQDHAPDYKKQSRVFPFHIHRYFLLDMPQTPQQGLHFALLLGWKFAANNFYLAAAIFCWLGRRRPGAGGWLSLGLGRRGNSWLDGRLWRRRIDAISKKVLLLHLLLDLLGMRLWRRRTLTRNVRFFCPHCHLFNAFKILHDVSGNVFRQATFKFGVIGIAFLPFLHTYQQISKRIQIMCGYILPPKKFG